MPHPALLVSERAIGTDQRQKYLLTVNKDNVVEYRRVKVGRLLDGMRVIESGLRPDDLVVVNGLQRARPARKCSRWSPKTGGRSGPSPAHADPSTGHDKTTND